jgi:hypothetical protein
MSGRATITCHCCGRTGIHSGRGLISSCYQRRRSAGTLPNTFLRHRSGWIPDQPQALTTLVRYGRLVTAKASKTRIKWELSLSERQWYRYAAAWRNLLALGPAEDAREAA